MRFLSIPACLTALALAVPAHAINPEALRAFVRHDATEMRNVDADLRLDGERMRLIRGDRVAGTCRFDFSPTVDPSLPNPAQIEIGRNDTTCESLVLEGQFPQSALASATALRSWCDSDHGAGRMHDSAATCGCAHDEGATPAAGSDELRARMQRFVGYLPF